MTFAEKIRIFLEKLQSLPEQKKKIILWVIVAVMAVIMGFFWIRGTMSNLSKLGGEIQKVEIPQINMPDITSLNEGNAVIKSSENKVYINSKYGFEIIYPTDWSFREYESGATFFPESKAKENTTGNGVINVGFYSRSASYCKIPFEDYVKIAGPSEIQNYESLNSIDGIINSNDVNISIAQWNYTDLSGVGKVSLPITYIETKPELCGGIEMFLNDNNYSDVYGEMIYKFKFTNTK
ncbi:MAG: hypothetical protein WCK10_03335 [Candidatus Staskawiczbacteria bacterium]